MENNMLTVKEVAQKLGVNPPTVYQMIAMKKIRCIRIGPGERTIRIRQSDYDEYLDDAETIDATTTS